MELLDPHWDAMTRLAFRITGNRDDAEDLAQEVCLQVIRQLPSFQGRCAFKTWMYRVALNVCISAVRRRRPAAPEVRLESLRDPAPSPEGMILGNVLRERVRDEILRLPASCRDAVLLRVHDEFSYAEIAEVLQISVGTAQVRVHRGMKQLRERLGPWIEEEERS